MTRGIGRPAKGARYLPVCPAGPVIGARAGTDAIPRRRGCLADPAFAA